MRAIQKIIIIIYFVVVAVACTYVPWIYEYKLMGYAFIWRPLMDSYYTYLGGKTLHITPYLIDYRRIVLELIAITAVFAILFVLTLRPKKD